MGSCRGTVGGRGSLARNLREPVFLEAFGDGLGEGGGGLDAEEDTGEKVRFCRAQGRPHQRFGGRVHARAPSLRGLAARQADGRELRCPPPPPLKSRQQSVGRRCTTSASVSAKT